MLNAPTQFTSSVLPDAARKALVAASDKARDIGNELARAIYMNEAIAKIRREYPQYFRE
ncbi:hypothetical protein [Caballeronia sp. AZ10_KS36]|uniref:hypothetical protein n=1 Tax=Caballeronia sp. AZ10_KS36 TaxID=2921757 RepID=UPI002027B323|nr:hypothetical protein [Caballeronia sp. AZ10_KS36]